MKPRARVILSIAMLSSGLIAHAALERAARIDRPKLNQPLASLPMVIGDWLGSDEPIAEDVVERAQTDEYINRIYENQSSPGQKVSLWINYSNTGLNLRHSPEVCLPSSGWERIESMQATAELKETSGMAVPISILAYSKDSALQRLGFWYYIFGEGKVHKAIRNLPITSRSSHGRTTRGSSMTIEIFRPQEDGQNELMTDFAQNLLKELEPILPAGRDAYFRP
ncbi:MAG: EpsI family protein [Planctomycetota bacterium]|nr:EpsI family protein [Planctomycetota bacterium]